ncbi:hypothetical protein GOARA_006_00100 [Gordonia araii NBRC 100433]|uniref:Uncharacterized protein n=1 Tax=Gordonia araii NBRC 100433 TaxID=1073574 RepID=G7GXC6_9ACTN|nr:hypothetical protein GOARA_006_00100 [Gordonia araii NBRC 100433]
MILTGTAVTQLERWASLWADLQHADIALYERAQMEPIPATIFQRRALWESAVIAYGRATQSERGRKVGFQTFVTETLTPGQIATHERIMDWRHGHVAHRRDDEFEEVCTEIVLRDGVPTELRVGVGIDAGASQDFVEEFQAHVFMLRNHVWEKKLAPNVQSVVTGMNQCTVSAEAPSDESPRPGDDRYTVTMKWDLDATPR